MQKKVKAKVRVVAPRSQTENTTRDLRIYRVELFLFCLFLHICIVTRTGENLKRNLHHAVPMNVLAILDRKREG